MAGWLNGSRMAVLSNGGNSYLNGKNGGIVEWQEWQPNGGRMAEWSNGKDGGMADGMAEWRPNGGMVKWRPNGGMVERWNGRMAKMAEWRTEWRNGGQMEEWQPNGGIVEWQPNGGMVEWRNGQMARMAEWSNGKNGGIVEWRNG